MIISFPKLTGALAPLNFYIPNLSFLSGGRVCWFVSKKLYLKGENYSNEMDETGAHYTEWSKPER